MAENPLLPGTDIEVVEKYAPGKRLDFPNFGSVRKTSFAKGVITDFEKISDDPLRVKPLVKVTGDFGESEYIPLFYHPKAQYWDDELADEPVLATDFDEEVGTFKQAWMSFRCDDEVAVMLKEGVPVAVVGFADGVPRIGENFVKADADDYPEAIFWGVLGGFFEGFRPTSEEKGPDDLDLGLKLPAESAEGGESGFHTSKASYVNRFFYGDTVNWFYYEPFTSIAKIKVYLVVIGPILFATYLFYSKSSGPGGTGWYVVGGLSGDISEWEDWVNAPETEENIIIPPPSPGTPSGDVSSPSVTEFSPIASLTKAGLYSKELYDKVLSTFGAPAVSYDGNPELDFCPWIDELIIQSGCFSASEGVEFMVRPHTKEELQAAGMWPSEN